MMLPTETLKASPWTKSRSAASYLPANYNTERTKAFGSNDESDPLYFTFTDFGYTSAQIAEFANKFDELKSLVFSRLFHFAS